MKHLYWWGHVWLCISDSHCTAMADLRLITVCINRENKCHHVLVSQNLAGFQPPSLSCQKKKVEIVFLLFVRLCLSTAFSFCLFSFLKRDSCEVTKPAEKLEVFLISPLGHTIPRLWPLFSFLPFFPPLFLHISPGTHSAASVSALVKTKTNFTQTFYNFAVCDL